MMNGAMQNGDHIGEAYSSVEDSLRAAGWIVSGSLVTVEKICAAYALPRLDAEEVSVEEAARSLDLLDENEEFRPGFKVYKAHAIYDFVVSYDGPFNAEHAMAVDRMVHFRAPIAKS